MTLKNSKNNSMYTVCKTKSHKHDHNHNHHRSHTQDSGAITVTTKIIITTMM